MINRISVQGFKSLYNLENLELGQVNVLIGANGSGKSNVLEALGLLASAVSGRVDDPALRLRGVRPGTPALYKTSLRSKSFRRNISLEAIGDSSAGAISYRVSLDNPIESPEATWHYHSESLHRGDKKLVGRSPAGQTVTFLPNVGPGVFQFRPEAGLISFLRGLEELGTPAREFLNILSAYVIYAPTTPVLRGTLPDSEQLEPVGLLGGRLPEAISELLNTEDKKLGAMDIDDVLSLLEWVSHFDSAAPSRQLLSPSVPASRRIVRFKDRWMRPPRSEISGYDASEGALYVLFVLVLAMHPRSPQFFAIEDFDQAMHPRLARAVIRTFCEQILSSSSQKQALITTHNPLVLDGLDLRDDRIRLFAVERGLGGDTRVHRIQVSAEILNQTQEGGLSLSTLWVMGRLGAVPDLF